MNNLHFQLVQPWLKIRLAKTTMPTHVKENITGVLSIQPSTSQGRLSSPPLQRHDTREEPSTSSSGENRKRKTYGKCHYKK